MTRHDRHASQGAIDIWLAWMLAQPMPRWGSAVSSRARRPASLFWGQFLWVGTKHLWYFISEDFRIEGLARLLRTYEGTA